jgi:CspA family cold shock protein
MEEVFEGEVIWFDPKAGYGFIQWEKEEDMFVHFSDVICEGFKTLKKGQKVRFSVGKNNTGKPKAIDVEVII